VPDDHPDAIGGVIVYAPKKSVTSEKKAIEGSIGRWSAATRAAADVGADAILVLSNLWWVAANGYFYDYVWHGALLSSIASLFSSRFRKVCIASASSVGNLQPWGTHPLLDPYFGSAHFQVYHDGLEMTRPEKMALVADWPAGLNNLRVCQNDSSGSKNCGKCEKCIRTQLGLLALGKLHQSCFPNKELDSTIIDRLWNFGMLAHEYDWGWYPPLIQSLEDCGRTDLADHLAEILARFQQQGLREPDEIQIW